VKIGILETGRPPDELLVEHGTYATMLMGLLDPNLERYKYTVFDVQAGGLPDQPESFDGYLITGSSAGVYDGHRWIGELKTFLQGAKGKAKLVGVCFGHQIMAEAFGGEVRKSERGWGVGLHRYALQSPADWIDAGAESFAVPASHQDQVIAPPPAARVLAANDHTPFAALVYEDQPAISFQGHPEFSPAYAAALTERRRGAKLSDSEVDRAVDSLKAPNDSARVAGWIRDFLEG
jgi:GMP synthase-like glutamine amidotransferase